MMQDARRRMQDASMKRLPSWTMPILLCWVAFGLRLGPLWANRFHSDEALYATWALRIATWHDPLLVGVAPDKPPLLFYVQAAAFWVLGHVEVAARLAGLIAGVVSVALVWRLALIIPLAPFFSQVWAKKGEATANVAAMAMTLSPFAILFSPTAFLDPLMVMFVLASLVAVMRRRHGWVGVWLGLAAATKVQALIFLPLVMALAVLCAPTLRHRTDRSRQLQQAVRFIVGLAVPVSLVLVWDRLRGGAPFWVQQTVNYGGIRLVYASEVLPRLAGWASWLPYFFGWPLLAVLIVGLPVVLAYDLTRGARTWPAAFDLTLTAFALAYFFLHWLLAFPAWDRYLLGLVPVMCVLLGRLASLAVGWLAARIRSTQAAGLMVAVFVVALMIPSAAQATQSALPVGGDHGPHDGIDRVSAYLRELPKGTVVYDHWLGWTLRYYLWHAPAYVAYFATPEWLAEDLHVFGRTSPRYIVFPVDESTSRVERAIAREGFGLTPMLSTRDRHSQPTFTLYRIDAYVEH
jgi:4-amino-4-deoxy-L-arabinose transferase-like glycosyltransferase